MYDEFADDPLVRLLTPNEERDLLINEFNNLFAQEIQITSEYRIELQSLRARRSDILERLEKLHE